MGGAGVIMELGMQWGWNWDKEGGGMRDEG